MTARSARRLAAAIGIACLPLAAAPKDGRLVVEPARWSEGVGEGVEVGLDGSVRAGMERVRLDDGVVDGTFVLALAADAVGNLYVGTGPAGKVYRVAPSGAVSEIFRADDPWITALHADATGDLLVASAPSGAIHRIVDGNPERDWSRSGARYVWAIARGPDGRLVATTGAPATLKSLDASGSSRTLLATADDHLLGLTPDGRGGWLVGSAGRGRLYRVDADGHALVLAEEPLAEVPGAVLDRDGTIWAVSLAAPGTHAEAAWLEFRLPGTADPLRAPEAADADGPAVPLAPAPRLHGRLVPSGVDDEAPRTVGRVVRIDLEGAPRAVWDSRRETPFAIALDGEGRPLFVTGPPATLWAVEGDGRVSRLARLPQLHASRVLAVGRVPFVATGDAAALYRFDPERSAGGAYLGPILDAGGTARWGRLSWHATGRGLPAEVYARSGNAATPDETWSGWSPRLADADGSPLDLPDGRYLQWRVRFAAGRRSDAAVSDLAVRYARRNVAPIGLRLEPVPGEPRQLRWFATDADGDRLRARLEVLDAGGRWHAPDPDRPDAPSAGGPGEQRGTLGVAPGVLADGVHVVRAVVDDGPSNAPDERLEAVLPEIRWRHDATPPAIEIEPRSDGGFDVTVRDATSTIALLEVWDGARRIHPLRPVDGVYDDRVERFVVEPVGDALRGEDAAGNEVRAGLPGRANGDSSPTPNPEAP